MAIFTPGRRWQPAFLPFRRVSWKEKLLTLIERNVKGLLFGCRMCGNCVLQETAFICPMQCSKGLRNGPCGGSTPEKCYVDESRPCIWYEIFDRSFRMGREEKLLEILAPLDWERVGRETWGGLLGKINKIGFKMFFSSLKDKNLRNDLWEEIFISLRQPDWWQKNGNRHLPLCPNPVSELQLSLEAGEFVVTAEVAPPLSVSTDVFLGKLEALKSCVTAVNFTDSPSANSRMASWACSDLAIRSGVEPIMQITARDRTRTGIQTDIIGANALGIRNILCLSGDSMRMGNAPIGRMDVSDLDSVQMLWILNQMQSRGCYLDGREIKNPPLLFLGAAASPMASRADFEAIRTGKKIEAGAKFLQTNLIFDVNRLEIWLKELFRRKFLEKAFILVGVTPLKSSKMARFLNDNVPGVFVPDKIIERMEKAEKGGKKEEVQEEGIRIALEIITRIKKLEGIGINGIHLMAVGWEEIVPRLVKDSGLVKM